MTTTAFMVDRFGGLNLADDPTVVGATGATELFNVDLDVSGRIRARAGYATIKAIATTTVEGLAAYDTTAGTSQVVVGHTTTGTRKYEAYASTGGAVVATATPGATAVNAARWGDPTNEYLYIANGTDTVWRWSGAAFTQPAGMPTAKYLAISPNSNRLVAANLSGLPSRVLFSNAGAPETFTYDTAPTPDTGDYVDLTPGDGSGINGATAWQNYIFVFKRDRFFVFTGESVDADGQPVFNYRTVDGFGSIIPPIAGDEGVYFFDGRTIWVTTGGIPTRVSRPVEPMLRGVPGVGVMPTVDPTLLASVRLFYSLGRLYVKIPTLISGFSSAYSLIFDSKVDGWTLYTTSPVPMEWVTTVRPTSTEQRFTYFFGGGAAGAVARFDPTLTVDPVGAFVWDWLSGVTDMGEPGRVKVTLESRLWGVGSVTMQCVTDGTVSTSSFVTLGTNPTSADGWQQIDREGTLWATQVAGTSWGGVDRLAHYVSFVKPAGVQ